MSSQPTEHAAFLERLERRVLAVLRDFDRERLARANGADDADPESRVAERRAPEVASCLEASDELAAAAPSEPARVAALAAHVVGLVRRSELAPSTDRLEALRRQRLRLGEVDRSLHEILLAVRDGRPDHVAEGAVERLLGRRSAARDEALGRAELRSRRLRALAATDVDRPREGVAEAARRFLDATDELSRECAVYVARRAGFEVRTAFDRLAASRAAELDDLVPVASRARRAAQLVAPLGFGERLGRGASVVGTRPELAFGPAFVEATPGRTTMVPADGVLGIEAECGFLLGIGRLLPWLDDSVAVPATVRRPRRACLGRALGAMALREAFDPRQLRAQRTVPAAVLERARRLASAWLLARMRLGAAALVMPEPRGAVEHALHVDCGAATARAWFAALDSAASFDGSAAGLAAYAALRGRHDEDFFRNPRAREELSVAVRRSFVEPFGDVVASLGLEDSAALELAGWFEGRHR